MKKDVTAKSIIQDLRRQGIKRGDRIFVHSSFKKIGLTKGGPEVVVDALKTLVTPSGTIGMPLFIREFSPNEAFNPGTSPSGVGIITEVFRKSEGVKRSYSPSHSVGCWGKDADYIVSGGTFKPPYSFEGPFGRLYDLDFKIVMLGCGLAPNSTIHAVEDWANLPYCVNGVTTCYARTDPDKTGRQYDYMPCGHRDFYRSGEASLESKYVKLLMRHGKLHCGKIGAGTLHWMHARELVDLCMTELDEHPDLFLCDDPKCSGCVNNKIELASWKARGGARWDWVKIGRSKVDITPAVDSYINQGWGPGMPGEGIYDPLYARVLVFRKKWERFAIVSMDLCQIPRDVGDQIKERIARRSHIPAVNTAICCTHAHYGPAIGNKQVWEKTDIRDESYIEELAKKVSGAIYLASKETIPATVGFDRRTVDIGGINRRVRLKDGTYTSWDWPPPEGHPPKPNGKPALDFATLVFKNSNGQVVAGIGHYACHPIFTPHVCRKITADYPGAFAGTVEQESGNGAVICFLQGALGDQMPLKPGTSYDLAVQAGKKLAWSFLDSAKKTGDQPLKTIQGKLITHRIRYSTKHPVVPLQVMRLNDIVIGFIGAEMLLDLDTRFRKQIHSPRSILVGVANDEIGYVVTREAFRHPTYEVRGCRRWYGGKPGIGEELIDECVRLAKSLL